ncbi:hypothetical protein HY501_03010, partial [Candidatus Woesearchaeota archaeon]|nr:hypothetical protein [Candidatus Woesearchaeota archaeon]
MDVREIADGIRQYGKLIALKADGNAYMLDAGQTPVYILKAVHDIVETSNGRHDSEPYRGFMECMDAPFCIVNKAEGNYEMFRPEGTRQADLSHLEEDFELMDLGPLNMPVEYG